METFQKKKKKERLGELLVAKNLVSQQSINDALQDNSGFLGSILEKKGLIAKKTLLETLVEQHGHPGILLSRSCIDLSALGYIPKFLALEHNILPVMKTENSIVLAVINPEQQELFDHVRYISNLYVITFIALSSEITEATEKAYQAFNIKKHILDLSNNTNKDTGEIAIHLEILRPKEHEQPMEIEWRIPWNFAFNNEIRSEQPIEAKESLSRKAKVLVVDDDPAINKMLCLIMKKDGYSVKSAFTGTKALQILQAFKPDLMLLDAMLPEVHGFEIAHHVKSSPTFLDTKVIMVSSIYRGWKSSKNILEIHSADAFVEKPFDVSYIRKLVSDMLGGHLEEFTTSTSSSEENEILQKIKEKVQTLYQKEDPMLLRTVLEWNEREPFNFIPHLIRGNLYWKLKHYDESLISYEQAATFAKQSKTANHNLAVAYQYLGFLSKAKARWKHISYLKEDLAQDSTFTERLYEF